MSDEIDKLIDDMSFNVLEDQFSRLCYETFILNENGKLLLTMLFKEYVHKPFLDIKESSPKFDPDRICVRVSWRDFVQRLLIHAQSYERALQNKGASNGRK